MPRVVVSWSGGKDSCLACYKALANGLEVSHLLNFALRDGERASHWLRPGLIAAQSRAVGIPLIQRETTWDAYERELKSALKELREGGVEGAVFGDVHVREHFEWVARVCNEVGVVPIEPLWGMRPEQVLREFVGAGFEAVVIDARADLFGEEWVGRRVDSSFIEDLLRLREGRDFDLCGEYGEYHTFVVGGPIFRRRVRLLEARRVLREAGWRRWSLDVLRWEVEGEVAEA